MAQSYQSVSRPRGLDVEEQGSGSARDKSRPDAGNPLALVGDLGVMFEPHGAALSGSASSSQGAASPAASGKTSSGLVFNITYEQNPSTLPPGFVAAINDVANAFENLFSTPITVNIEVGYGTIDGQPLASGALGESEAFLASYGYSAVKNALGAVAPSAAANLPSSMPVNGSMWVATAEAKALGLPLQQPNTSLDGFVGFSSTLPFTYDPNHRAVAGAYDFIGVVEHEFSEVMGRIDLFGEDIGNGPGYTLLDMFHYTAPGTHTYTGGPTNYFSANGGISNLNYFNTSPYGDLGDWAASAGADAFLAFSPAGQSNAVSSSDVTEMNALGYSTTRASSFSVVGTAAKALQGGPAINVLASTPIISDSARTTLAAASVRIANASANPVAGDELYLNGQQSGTTDGGAVTVNWNDSTKTLTLAGVAPIAVYETLLSGISYKDSGSDSSSGTHPQRILTWSANDGTATLSTTSQIAIDRAPVAKNDTAWVLTGGTVTANAATGVLANDTDLDNDALTVSGVSDAAHGAGSLGQSFAGQYGHLTLYANGSYTYSADIASAIANAPTGSHPQDGFSYLVSDGTGGTATATLDIVLDRPPTVNVANLSLSRGQGPVSASSLFTASDPDGDTLTTYAFWDSGTGGGHFVLNGVAQPSNHEIDVSASQLAQLTYQAGTGGDTLWVRANDGKFWSNWSKSFTVSPAVDRAPQVSAANLSLSRGQSSVAASALFTASDPDGDPIAKYAFWDTGSGGGHFVLNGVAQGANHEIDVTSSQLSQLTYQIGASADTLWVRANDGLLWSNWSNSFSVSPATNSSAKASAGKALASASASENLRGADLISRSVSTLADIAGNQTLGHGSEGAWVHATDWPGSTLGVAGGHGLALADLALFCNYMASHLPVSGSPQGTAMLEPKISAQDQIILSSARSHPHA